jgi:hypothetical protein
MKNSVPRPGFPGADVSLGPGIEFGREAMAELAQAWPEAVTVPTHGTVAESVELACSVWRASPAATARR